MENASYRRNCGLFNGLEKYHAIIPRRLQNPLGVTDGCNARATFMEAERPRGKKGQLGAGPHREILFSS